MAKRRVVTSDIVWQSSFNSLSIEAMALFPKLLSCSDDFGVLPSDLSELRRLISPPDAIADFGARVEEYVQTRILHRVPYKSKFFLVFEPSSFEKHQSYFIKKRTKSDFLGASKSEFEIHIRPLFQTFLEELPESDFECIESRKQKVESREQQVEGEGGKSYEPVKPKSVADVEMYFIGMRLPNAKEQATLFFNNYEGVGWMKGGQPIRDWKSLAHSWVIRSPGFPTVGAKDIRGSPNALNNLQGKQLDPDYYKPKS
jgi:hypothetical protein